MTPATRQRDRTRQHTMGTLQRVAGITAWMAAGELLIALGSLQGTSGSWVTGWALYAVMAREWSEDPTQAGLVSRHAWATFEVAAVALGASTYMGWLTGTDWSIPWAQLPMITIGLGAFHNAMWGPSSKYEKYYSGEPPGERPRTDSRTEDR